MVKLQGTMPMYFNGAKVSDKLYKMLRDHQAALGGSGSWEFSEGYLRVPLRVPVTTRIL